MSTTIRRQQYTSSGLAVDVVPMAQIWYDGALAADISYDGSNYTFRTAAANDVSVNPAGATAGLIGNSELTTSTIGELIDILNADTDGNWHGLICGGFRDTPNQLTARPTQIVVTENGMAAGTGTVLGGITGDVSLGIAGQHIALAVFGPEADDTIPSRMRSSCPLKFHKSVLVGALQAYTLLPGGKRDVADKNFDKIIGGPYYRAFVDKIDVLMGNGAGVLTLTVRSVKQDDDLADSRILWTETLAEDTQLVLNFAEGDFEHPAPLVGGVCERIVVDLLPATVALDAFTVDISGGYQVGGEGSFVTN